MKDNLLKKLEDLKSIKTDDPLTATEIINIEEEIIRLEKTRSNYYASIRDIPKKEIAHFIICEIPLLKIKLK